MHTFHDIISYPHCNMRLAIETDFLADVGTR